MALQCGLIRRDDDGWVLEAEGQSRRLLSDEVVFVEGARLALEMAEEEGRG